jgi:hypothetical protein
MTRVRTKRNLKKSHPSKKKRSTSTTLAIRRSPKHRNHPISHKLSILRSLRKSSMIYITMSTLSMQARRQPRASVWMSSSTLNRLHRRSRRDIRNTITTTKKPNRMEENLPRRMEGAQSRSGPNLHLEAPVFSSNTLARPAIPRHKFKGERLTLQLTIMQSQAPPLKLTTLEALMTSLKFFGHRSPLMTSISNRSLQQTYRSKRTISSPS